MDSDIRLGDENDSTVWLSKGVHGVSVIFVLVMFDKPVLNKKKYCHTDDTPQ